MRAGDPDRIHWPDLVREGIAARKQLEGAQWRLGDLAREVTVAYGGRDLQQYAEEVAVEYRTLLDYRRVASAFQSSERSEVLAWSHHQILAGRGDRVAWLRLAEREGWRTVSQLRRGLARGNEYGPTAREAYGGQPIPASATAPSNGILPLEVMWPTAQALLTSLARSYYQAAEDIERVRRLRL
jgi:hypothetical protein